jgi:hypothetical protein
MKYDATKAVWAIPATNGNDVIDVLRDGERYFVFRNGVQYGKSAFKRIENARMRAIYVASLP